MHGDRGLRARIATTAGGGVALCALLAAAGCGGGGTTTATETVTATQAVSSAGSAPPATRGTGAPAPAIGEVPGSAGAAKALRPWLADVTAKDLPALTSKCWTQPPSVIGEMYGDAGRITEAVSGPGVLGQFGPTWKSATTTVQLRPSEVASSYGCPDVYAANGSIPLEKARYAVVRYLGRHVGKPVDPADVEADYPLLCPAGDGAPDLAEVTGFDAAQVGAPQVVKTGSTTVTSVSAQVATRSGIRKSAGFVLDRGPNGYCIRRFTLR